MKISRWHKSKGDEVFLNKCAYSPDKVYASCVFKKNAAQIERTKACYPGAEIGGSGVDLDKWLPEDIEHLMPDYDLYQGFEWGIRGKQNESKWMAASMGFTSRGCIRKCKFCIVNRKEGMIRAWTDIYEFWDREKHKTIILYDNNILAAPNFERTCLDLIKNKLFVDFNQGLDIRIVTPEKAKLLSKLKVDAGRGSDFRFAFDLMEVEPAIRKNLPILFKAGIKPYRIIFYVICGFNTTFEEDIYRLKVLQELGVRAYVMLYENASEKLKVMQAWNNNINKTRPFYVCKLEDYKPYRNLVSAGTQKELF